MRLKKVKRTTAINIFLLRISKYPRDKKIFAKVKHYLIKKT